MALARPIRRGPKPADWCEIPCTYRLYFRRAHVSIERNPVMLKTFGESSSDVKSHDFMRTYAAKNRDAMRPRSA